MAPDGHASGRNAVLALFRRALHAEASGGIVLFAAALLAIACANAAGIAEWRSHWLHSPLGFHIGAFQLSKPTEVWINDGLMAIFFLMVSLEIKREFLLGELSSRAKALLPVAVAAGGMVVPAVIYVAFNWSNSEALQGWAIPTATDIAFSLGVLSLLGKRVPLALKVFMTAIAVIDDLGAIAIIAVFYSADLNTGYLAGAVAVVAALAALNQTGVRRLWPYLALGVVLWYLVLQSGVHATLAGVAVALTIPLRNSGVAGAAPLERLERALHTPVTFAILPLFAFANAGVDFRELSLSVITDPLPLGIAFGLFFGKFIGICGATFLTVKTLRIGKLPEGCDFRAVTAVAFLCGIGFTVSLFIGNLAFPGDPEQLNLVKLGVLLGSTVSGITGYLFLRRSFARAAA